MKVRFLYYDVTIPVSYAKANIVYVFRFSKAPFLQSVNSEKLMQFTFLLWIEPEMQSSINEIITRNRSNHPFKAEL